VIFFRNQSKKNVAVIGKINRLAIQANQEMIALKECRKTSKILFCDEKENVFSKR